MFDQIIREMSSEHLPSYSIIANFKIAIPQRILDAGEDYLFWLDLSEGGGGLRLARQQR